MSKKLKVIIWIVIVLAVLSFILLKVFGVDTVWSVIPVVIASVAGVLKIASFFTESKDDSTGGSQGITGQQEKKPPISNPPLPPKSTGKTLFDITRIDCSDFIITVNFKSKDGLNAIDDIDVSVGVRDICSIKNSQDFPIKSLAPLGQFYVELRRHSDDDRISDITIKCVTKNGPWSEVRHIDVNDLKEVQNKKRK